jgi:hypothetical protein
MGRELIHDRGQLAGLPTITERINPVSKRRGMVRWNRPVGRVRFPISFKNAQRRSA